MIYGTLIVIVGGLIVCLCKMKRFKKKLMKLYRIGKVKLRTIFFVFQVISSFASISKDTGAQVKYPQPAASVAAAMGAANLDLFSFVSLRCMLPDTHFYTNLLIKTMAPFAVIALLFTYPLVLRASRKPYQKAWQTSARLSLFMLELVLPSTTTTIGQTLACDHFDNGWFLRAQLTIPCDGSRRRKVWVTYASLMIAIFPLGEDECALARHHEYNALNSHLSLCLP